MSEGEMTELKYTTGLAGIPIVTSRNVPPGKFYLIDGSIFTSMNMDQLMVKIWVGDMMKSLRAHLAQLVADAERRLGLAGVSL